MPDACLLVSFLYIQYHTVWLVSQWKNISLRSCRLSRKLCTVTLWHEVRHPRTSKQHDKCHTKNHIADHDSVSPISQTSTPPLPNPLTTSLSTIPLTTVFDLQGWKVLTKWRRYSCFMNVGSKLRSRNDTKTSGCRMRLFFKPSRPNSRHWRLLDSIGASWTRQSLHMKVQCLTTSPYQIELADSEDTWKVLISMEIRSKQTFGNTLSQLQEDWWHAHQMEKGIFIAAAGWKY
jgi:hypothetical protein